MQSGSNRVFRDMRETAAQKAPEITFPCDYPIKVVGDAAEDFAAVVCAVIKRHAPDFNAADIRVIDSRNGRFQSVRLSIRATGEAQLKALFEELKATGRVHMVV